MCFYLSVRVCTMHMPDVLGTQTVGSPGTQVIDGCGLLCEYWEPNQSKEMC